MIPRYDEARRVARGGEAGSGSLADRARGLFGRRRRERQERAKADALGDRIVAAGQTARQRLERDREVEAAARAAARREILGDDGGVGAP